MDDLLLRMFVGPFGRDVVPRHRRCRRALRPEARLCREVGSVEHDLIPCDCAAIARLGPSPGHEAPVPPLRQEQLGRYAAAMTDREVRIAKNEAIVREINEGIEESKASRTPEGDAPVMCECGNLDCELLITITVSEYEDVRQNARRFVVVKDHVIPDVERVVAETERFDVVEKVEGTSAGIAEALDPRD
jgi:hypothetical protein